MKRNISTCKCKEAYGSNPKTSKQICRFYIQGNCRFNQHCRFLHENQNNVEIENPEQQTIHEEPKPCQSKKHLSTSQEISRKQQFLYIVFEIKFTKQCVSAYHTAWLLVMHCEQNLIFLLSMEKKLIKFEFSPARLSCRHQLMTPKFKFNVLPMDLTFFGGFLR